MAGNCFFLAILIVFLRWGKSELNPSIQWTPKNPVDAFPSMNDELLSVTLLVVFLPVGTSELYPSIQWTPRNPLFSQNKTQCVYAMSKVIFVCPNPAMIVGIQQEGTAKESMYENLWLVNKQSYDQCKVNISNPENKLLLKCMAPLKLTYYTVVFQKYSAAVGDPEYTPGEEYYFIATSDGNQLSIGNTAGGHCRTKNMRLEFHVCHNETDAHCENPDKCNMRKDPTNASPTTLQKSETEHTSTTVMPTTNPTKSAGPNNTITQDLPGNPAESGSRVTKYLVAIGLLTALTIVLVIATWYLFYRLRLQKREKATDFHLREKLHSPTL